MAELNKAYEQCDAQANPAHTARMAIFPEQVQGDGTAAQLVRVIRRIALARERFDAIKIELDRSLHEASFIDCGSRYTRRQYTAEICWPKLLDTSMCGSTKPERVWRSGQARVTTMTDNYKPLPNSLSVRNEHSLIRPRSSLVTRGLQEVEQLRKAPTGEITASEPAPRIVTPEGITLVLIPAGTFLAGGLNLSLNGRTRYEAYLPAYYLAMYPLQTPNTRSSLTQRAGSSRVQEVIGANT